MKSSTTMDRMDDDHSLAYLSRNSVKYVKPTFQCDPCDSASGTVPCHSQEAYLFFETLYCFGKFFGGTICLSRCSALNFSKSIAVVEEDWHLVAEQK